MDIQQIRNATLKIVYQGKTFLIDPWLCGKGSLGSFGDIPGKPYMIPDPVKMEIAMPIYGLPRTPQEILNGVDYYIVTHIHPDHVDIAADGTVGQPLDKSIPVFVQNEQDAAIFEKSGFQDVQVLSKSPLTLEALPFNICRHAMVPSFLAVTLWGFSSRAQTNLPFISLVIPYGILKWKIR